MLSSMGLFYYVARSDGTKVGSFAVRMEERHIAIGHCRYTTPILVYSNIITASSLQYVCEADIIDECSVLGIDRVVLIFDLDGSMGGMLTYEDVKKRYTEISGVEILYYPIAWCAETLLHYQIRSYVTDAEIYTVPKQVKILLQSIAGKNVKKTDAILNVPVLKQRLLEIDRQILLDREIIEYLLGMSNNAFTLSELEVWMKRATKKYNDNYGW